MGEFGDGRLDGSGEVGELAEDEGFKVRQVANGGGDLAGDVAGKDGEGEDPVGGGVTVDAVPVATVVFWDPGGQEVGIAEGFFDLEEDFFVFWVAAL